MSPLSHYHDVQVWQFRRIIVCWCWMQKTRTTFSLCIFLFFPFFDATLAACNDTHWDTECLRMSFTYHPIVCPDLSLMERIGSRKLCRHYSGLEPLVILSCLKHCISVFLWYHFLQWSAMLTFFFTDIWMFICSQVTDDLKDHYIQMQLLHNKYVKHSHMFNFSI